MKQNFFLSSLGIINSLGSCKEEVFENLIEGYTQGMIEKEIPISNKKTKVGQVKSNLPQIPDQFKEFNFRSNQLLLSAYLQIENDIQYIIKKYTAERIGIIIGSTTSGVDEAQLAIAEKIKTNKFPESFDYKFLEMGSPSSFLMQYLKLKNISYTISTACSSSAKVFSSAYNLLNLDICDAVLIGGVDSLSSLTINGFNSLGILSSNICNPLSQNRDGISLGEGASLFILTKEKIGKNNIALLGIGENSDAYHFTAPNPTGEGALMAMKSALNQANLGINDIDYINLHGTGTIENDQMESMAIYELFQDQVYCSSTKPLMGHLLGASGISEIALCWLLLAEQNYNKFLPPHIWDTAIDPSIKPIKLINQKKIKSDKLSVCMSNSFAFGGSNATLIIGKV